jgi:hypothetical protein
MSTRVVSIGLVQTLAATVVISVAGHNALAQTAAHPAEPSKQQREQMAVLHEKIAACLRSDKDIAACRDEMRSKCQEMMGEQGCPMMGMGMHEGTMQHGPADKPDGE